MRNPEHHPRTVAVRIIGQVLNENIPLDEALDAATSDTARGWLQEVCSGVLRWKTRIDQAIDSASLSKKPSGWLRRCLLVGAYQLVVQDRAHPGKVVSETVSEIKKKEGEAPARYANAVLRKVADHAAEWRALPFPEKGLPAALPALQAAWSGLSPWFWRKLEKQEGVEWARAFALASLERPAIWLRTNNTNLEGAVSGPVPGSQRMEAAGSVTEFQGFAEGGFIVQDISSQCLVAEVSAAVFSGIAAETGKPATPTALDLCAAPGGKSIGLAWNGFRVTATDHDARRMKLLADNVRRTGARIDAVPWSEKTSLRLFDLVWVDAPCTGSGIVRRHPDVRWLRQESDLPGLTALQADLLTEGWNHVRPGGFLVYSVCSVFQEEGPEVLKKAALAGTHEIKRWKLAPHEAPFGDGFWAILLKKAQE